MQKTELFIKNESYYDNMTLTKEQVEEIKVLLRKKIEFKLEKYARETSSMPFLAKLMQDSEKVAAYSFIHSLATTLGMSIYEQISKIIAKADYDEVKVGYDVEGYINDEENAKITKILQEVKNGSRTANKNEEIQEILSCSPDGGRKIKIRVDLFLKKGDVEYYIEIKTAKPNIDVFAKSKQKLLEWVALRKKRVNTILAIPYNPYYPEPYNRFTMQGYLDEKEDLFVADKFWDLIGGKGTYQEVLNIFDEIGKEFKEKIQDKIKEVAEKKMDV
ncbi:MAG: TdeIII family type II restriction endonuclease [Candidatus Omnitrophica bacterium]|nr:TdeIII family type II restriction endonuclease [Candidatus Omnitrophota bacterium]